MGKWEDVNLNQSSDTFQVHDNGQSANITLSYFFHQQNEGNRLEDFLSYLAVKLYSINPDIPKQIK